MLVRCRHGEVAGAFSVLCRVRVAETESKQYLYLSVGLGVRSVRDWQIVVMLTSR
jgi:hypothetical protein